MILLRNHCTPVRGSIDNEGLNLRIHLSAIFLQSFIKWAAAVLLFVRDNDDLINLASLSE
ncbi:hypothetical protein D3C84_1209790 [compost metagenome]